MLIGVHKSIKSSLLASNPHMGHLFVFVGPGEYQFIVGTAYFPPRAALECYVAFRESIDKLCDDLP